jgi:hypothetical protein
MVSTTTLKNAANAIGYDLWSDPDGSHYLVDYDGVKLRRWDPEHSSADSFELMAALNMDLTSLRGCGVVIADDYDGEHKEECDYTEDRSRDYRNAILLCAASIGESLCQS